MPEALPPIRTDLFAIFILLGAVQGYFLSYFFLFHGRGNRLPNLFLGLLILGMSVIITDIWLGYTNYMFQVLWLVDFSEPINLLLAPSAFLYIKTGVDQKFEKKDLLHFLPSVLYFIYMCLMIYPQSNAFKYNSNIGSFHPEMHRISAYVYGNDWMFFLKRNITNTTLISMIFYNIAGFSFLNNSFKKQELTFFTRQDTTLTWYRRFHLQLLILVLVFFATRVSFPHDLGDHIIATFIALIIYATSITVFSKSLFFHETGKTSKKYEKSSLTTELQNTTLKKLEDLMTIEKPFLDAGFSLPVLAKRLGISTHHLSQILNEELGQSFFDFLAAYRIAEAQRLLLAEENNYIKIEEIAQMVGYNSKSAFNTSFRKITGFTPSEFKKQSAK